HEPAIAERRPRLLRIAEISLRDDRMLHPEFAGDVRPDLVAVIIDDLALGPLAARVGVAPDRPHRALLVRSLERVAANTGNLGHPEAADQVRNKELVPENGNDV